MREDVTAAPSLAPRRTRVSPRARRARIHMRIEPAPAKQRPLIVELVGVWGAGKSSLVRSLVSRDEAVHAAPPVWSLPKALLALGGVEVFATVAGAAGQGSRLTWKEGRQLVRLRALYHHLELLRRTGAETVVVEDGPALILSWLRAAADRSNPRRGAPSWWSDAVRRWAKTVDIVVFLDAPDSVVTRRVLARAQDNPFKSRPESELTETLTRSRDAYRRILAELPAAGPPVLSFRTDRHSIAKITDELFVTLERERDGD